MPSTKTTEAPRKIIPREMRLIPETGWISLSKVCPGGDPDAMERGCQRLGIEVDTTDHRRAGLIRIEDVEKFIGPVKARMLFYGITPGKPDMMRADQAAHVLGIVCRGYGDNPEYQVSRGETIGLAERRGVLVDRSPAIPEVSLSGLTWLKRILDVERSYPIADEDWFDGAKALPEMRRASRVSLSMPTRINESDPNSPRYVSDSETLLIDSCLLIGVRWRKPQGKPWEVPGSARVVGFDLFRLYGIAMPGADVETYQEMMDAAHAAVLGVQSNPQPAA